jgi:pSer/pThr/pTyr-binding forkhead associated (FHA) protein
MPKAELVVIAQDGSPGRRFPLPGNDLLVGTVSHAAVSLPKDPYVSPEHARISYRNGSFFIDDCGSTNGVFVRIGGSVPLTSGDVLLVGLGVMRFELIPEAERTPQPILRGGVRVFGTPPSPRYGRLTVLTVEDKARDVYYLSRAETVLGRELGDIVFTDDPFMSRRHAALRRDPNTNHFTLRDLGSSNGTFVAIRGSHALSPGDHVRVGQHLFRLDVRRGG